MRIEQITSADRATLRDANLVFAFGESERLKAAGPLLGSAYPGAIVAGCSTAGEILGDRVQDGSLAITALKLERSTVHAATVELSDFSTSREAGRLLASKLPAEGLKHAVVISDGLKVNGSELARGLAEGLPAGVAATGGLAADADRFKQTFVLHGQEARQGTVSIIGLYGNVKTGYGSIGGWDPFGPERRITRSSSNRLYDLDGESALGLYKKYLGEFASGLPLTALRFPLRIRATKDDPGIVRTVLSIDPGDNSMTFAGDMPAGWYAAMMQANFNRLIDGAVNAAQSAASITGRADFALLISCVGRKLILKQRVEEEIEGVREVLGPGTATTGFYSYGELSPLTQGVNCELHNQTMTVTTFSE